MSAVYTEADLAGAWNSGYWHGTSHEGPLNDAAVAAKNPYKKSGLDTPAKKSVQTAEETPIKEILPMQHSTKYPVTVRELVEMAEERGMEVSRMLEVLGPIPMPPEGYTLAQKSDTRWIGQEIVNSRYIITPAWTWNSAGGFHSIELWVADHEAPDYAVLSPADALQLAADLTVAANALPGNEN